jgi:hypothetical protein
MAPRREGVKPLMGNSKCGQRACQKAPTEDPDCVGQRRFKGELLASDKSNRHQRSKPVSQGFSYARFYLQYVITTFPTSHERNEIRINSFPFGSAYSGRSYVLHVIRKETRFPSKVRSIAYPMTGSVLPTVATAAQPTRTASRLDCGGPLLKPSRGLALDEQGSQRRLKLRNSRRHNPLALIAWVGPFKSRRGALAVFLNTETTLATRAMVPASIDAASAVCIGSLLIEGMY